MKKMSLKHTLTASAIMLLTLLCYYGVKAAEEIHPNKALSGFPKQIGEWKGTEKFFDKNIYDTLKVSDSFLADYYNPKGYPIYFYVGFYQSQREGELIHSPKNCMPGAGWNIEQTSLEELETPQTGKVKVIKLILQRGPNKEVMLYWFHSRGRIISSEYMEKVYLVWDSITRHRTDGSFVRLLTPVIKNEDEDAAANRLRRFAEDIMPLLFEYIPS
jgi:EpsI family protein